MTSYPAVASPVLCWMNAAIGAMKEIVKSSFHKLVGSIAVIKIGKDVPVESLANHVSAQYIE